MIGKVGFWFNVDSFLWPFQPYWGGLIMRLARSTAKRRVAIWPAPGNFQCRIFKLRKTELTFFVWPFFWTNQIKPKLRGTCDGCRLRMGAICVMFQGLDEDTSWKSEKGDDSKAQGVFWCLKSSLPNGHLKGDKWVTHSDTSKWHKWWHNSWNSVFPFRSSNSRVVLVPRAMTRKVRWMRANIQATWRLVIVLDTKQRSLKWSCGIQILWCFIVFLCAWHAKACKGVFKHWIWIPRSLKISTQRMRKAVKDKRVVFWCNLGHLWTF